MKSTFIFIRKLALYVPGVLWLIAGWSCRKETHEPVESGGAKPGTVQNVKVTSLPGGAKLTYSLPSSDGILYVLAEFDRSTTDHQQVKASYYNNSLQVQGFADTLPHRVTLYVVTRSEVKSDSVVVIVNPLMPPFRKVFRTLSVSADFGGINIHYSNPDTAHIVVVTCSNDSTGVYGVVDNHYNNVLVDSFSVRGFDTTRRKFGVFIKDQYGNHSDTLTGYYTPFFEMALDKGLFSELDLPGDINYDWGRPIPDLWDNSLDDDKIWHSQPVDQNGWPVWITFDMGVTAKLSRCALWQRQGDDWIYQQNNPTVFEIWGSTDPNPDGSWDASWQLLVHHEVVKPSGLPQGSVSTADQNAALAGEQMTVPLDAPPVRYIRIKTLSTWTMAAVNIAEVSFWGKY